jgi:hypothetical protein
MFGHGSLSQWRASINLRRRTLRELEGRVSLDTRWENIDALLARTERTKDETLSKAVREIAEARFQFPSEEHAAYRTHINVPDVVMGVQIGDGGEEVAPSIVVVERLKTGDSRLVMTAQVCGREDVNEAEAKRIWAKCAAIPNQAFYLYVPVGMGAEAKKVCRRAGVRPEGFRTWRTTPRGFEVNDVSEQPSPLAALMPPIVRKLLATP